MFPEWTWIVGLFVGAFIGSFMNMAIYRLPRRLSLSNPPRSFCPTCKHPLGVVDLFPLLSWLFLGGKCRHCKAPIGPRYFVVELINGGIWAWLWWQYLIVGWDPARGIAYALFGSALLVALITDLEHYIIPDEVNAFLLIVGVGYHGIFGDITVALFGALTGWGLLWGVAFLGRVAFGKDAMGHGDIKMARGMGALLGPLLVLAAFMLAVVVGAVLGIVQLAMQRRKAEEVETGDEEYVPETVGSLAKCGLGYLMLVDVVALFAPKAGAAWFGDEEEVSVEEDDWEPQPTAIPFGPYLAIGAVAAAMFATPITNFLNDYFSGAGGQTAALEHVIVAGGHRIV